VAFVSYQYKSHASFKIALVGLGLACVLAACGNPAGQSSDSGPPSLQSTSQASGPSAADAPSDGLTGYGATSQEWNAHHTADSRFDPGSAYDPDSSLAPNQGQDVYVAVNLQDGRVVDYQMNIPGGSIRDAIARALEELPPDAYKLWGVARNGCYLAVLTSRTLSKVLGNLPIGQPNSNVDVEFTTMFSGIVGYDNSDVNTILVGPGSTPAADSIEGC
jgi:hypothetical protein